MSLPTVPVAITLGPTSTEVRVQIGEHDVTPFLSKLTVTCERSALSTLHFEATLPKFTELRGVLAKEGITVAAPNVSAALAPWLRHHAQCARVQDAAVCDCGLEKALEGLS